MDESIRTLRLDGRKTMPLYLNNSNLDDISDAISEASIEILKAYESEAEDENAPVKPEMIAEALGELIDIMYMVEIDQASCALFSDMELPLPSEILYNEDYRSLTPEEISELGQHGLSLLQTLSEWAGNLHLSKESQQLRAVSVIVALWVARHGGRLSCLEVIVDTLAQIANKTNDQKVLKELSSVMGELIGAVHSDIRRARCSQNAFDIWRIFNINRGIIAVRTEDMNTIDSVFEQLSDTIPDQAAEYFEANFSSFTLLRDSTQAQRLLRREAVGANKRILH